LSLNLIQSWDVSSAISNCLGSLEECDGHQPKLLSSLIL
jgi:hypothetical protein